MRVREKVPVPQRQEAPWYEEVAWHQQKTEAIPEERTYWYTDFFARLDEFLGENAPSTHESVQTLTQEWCTNSRDTTRALMSMTVQEINELPFTHIGRWGQVVRKILQELKPR